MLGWLMDVNVKTKYLKIIFWREAILLTLCFCMLVWVCFYENIYYLYVIMNQTIFVFTVNSVI
mgnify:CR=1 FL=1